jgi:hypothetical protein
MRWGIVAAVVALTLPLSAGAQSIGQKQANMEEALRQQQLICAGMADVNARGGGYTGHQLAQCLVALETQRADYQRFMEATGFSNRLSGAASASLR